MPTLLVSKYINQCTVFREPHGSPHPYDHTSFIKTFLLWAGIDPASWLVLANESSRPRHLRECCRVNRSNEAGDMLDSVPLDAVAEADPGIAFEPLPEVKPLNGLFEGMPFAVVKAILSRSKDMEDVDRSITGFKQDAEKFETSLMSERKE